MKRLWLSLFTGSIITLAGLTGCAAPSSSTAEIAQSSGGLEPEADSGRALPEATAQKLADPKPAAGGNEPLAEQASAQRPQLIKRASLSLSVESIEESIQQVREIVSAQQGDILSLSDRSQDTDAYRGDRTSPAGRQQATLFEIRVPQDRFDSAIDAFAEIGEVQDRAIATEDVSSQLVDLQARISNSQKSEEALKEIMSRSGKISDVLEVSRELSQVRQDIEQMRAAQQSLKTQISFSTISVSLESAIVQTPNQPAFTRQLANTWSASTSSVGHFTTDLLQLGLWLLVYSPYIAILLVGAVIARKVLRRSTSD